MSMRMGDARIGHGFQTGQQGQRNTGGHDEHSIRGGKELRS